jgi:glycosyltransferase involved in cell wall biosynthesis
MKILLTGLSLVPRYGGLPKTMRKFGEALGAKIVSFTSATLPQEELDAFPEVKHIRTGRSKISDWYAWVRPKDRVPAEEAASEADLLSCHVMLRYHAHWVRRMAKRHNIPYWFVPHGQLDPYVYTYRAGIKHLWLKLFGQRLMREAAHVIYSTEQERKKAEWFYKGDNTRVVHWPVDLIDVSEKAQAREALRNELGLKEEDRVLLYLGRIHSMKNPIKTIELLAESADPRVHLLIVGPDGDVSAQECNERARALGVAGQVHVAGPLYGEAKMRALLGSDAFISLSHRENFGHTAAESIAAATPVILSPGNDLGPDLMPYDCGLFLEDDSMECAVRAIHDFMAKDNAELEAMGIRGRSFVEEKLSFEMFQERLQSLASEAIEKHNS